MIHLNVLGQHFVILNSLEVTTDLFEKRSSNYSDRKQTTMLIELYVSSYFFTLKNFQKYRSLQNGFEDEHGHDAIRPVVAETQEIDSRVFPP
jgi:hypothetical protein